MYSYEEQLRAVKLYIKYDHSISAVIRELGYPSHQALLQWYQEYQTHGDLRITQVRQSKCTPEQRRAAVAYYKEDIGRASRPCRTGSSLVKLQQSEKEQAVIGLCVRDQSAECIASKYGVSRGALYKWKSQMLSKECVPEMSEKSAAQPADTEHTLEELRFEIATLEDKVAELQKQVAEYEQAAFRARLQKDIYEKASELI